MIQRISELLISLGGVSGVIGGANWHVSQGETALASVLVVVGLALLVARREIEDNGRLEKYT